MNNVPDSLASMPMWVAVVVSLLAIAGSALTLLGSVGLTRFKTFYERVHAPTLGTTLGMTLIVVAAIVFYSVIEGRLNLKPLLIGAFLTVTTPVTLVVLARAAIYRDRVEGKDVPGDDF